VLLFVLILLLVAAALGVLGAVLKIAFALLLGLILAITLIIWGTWLYVRHRLRTWQRDVDQQRQERDRRRRAVDIRYLHNEAEGERTDGGPRKLEDGEPPTE
jgi:fatty acid desaturase